MKHCLIGDKLAATSRRSGAGCGLQPTAPAVRVCKPPTATGEARSHVAAAAVQSSSTCANGQQLLLWVQAQGGYVHPNLAVQAHAGMRGVVAVGPIGTCDRLMVVPEHLCMTSTAAKARYSAMFGFAELTDAFPDPAYPLALMLAIEKRHAQQPSFWQPYIAALPDRPSCAWWMDAGELAAASADLRRRFPELDVAGEVDHFRRNTQDLCRVIALTLGTPFGVTEDDMFWALGQVRSRGFRQAGGQVALVPVLDLVNHRDFALRLPQELVGGQAVVLPSHAGCSWQAGEEVLLDYFQSEAEPMPPLLAFLHYGFAPPSVLVQSRCYY